MKEYNLSSNTPLQATAGLDFVELRKKYGSISYTKMDGSQDE